MHISPSTLCLPLVCVAAFACGDPEPLPDDDARAQLVQALGLGAPSGPGDRLGARPGGGDRLGAAPGTGDGLGAAPGPGDGLGRPAGSGNGLGAGSASAGGGEAGPGNRGACAQVVEDLVACGFIEPRDRQEATESCSDTVRSTPGAAAILARCVGGTCDDVLECLGVEGSAPPSTTTPGRDPRTGTGQPVPG